MTLDTPPQYIPPRPSSTLSYERAWRHVNQRLIERHGITVGLIEFTRICLERAERPFRFDEVVAREKGGRFICRIRFQGVNIPVIWCPKAGLIVTVYQGHFKLGSPGEIKADQREHRQRLRRKIARYRRHAKHRGA